MLEPTVFYLPDEYLRLPIKSYSTVGEKEWYSLNSPTLLHTQPLHFLPLSATCFLVFRLLEHCQQTESRPLTSSTQLQFQFQVNIHSIPLTVILAKALIHRVKSPKARTFSWQRNIKGMENALKEGPKVFCVVGFFLFLFLHIKALSLPSASSRLSLQCLKDKQCLMRFCYNEIY